MELAIRLIGSHTHSRPIWEIIVHATFKIFLQENTISNLVLQDHAWYLGHNIISMPPWQFTIGAIVTILMSS